MTDVHASGILRGRTETGRERTIDHFRRLVDAGELEAARLLASDSGVLAREVLDDEAAASTSLTCLLPGLTAVRDEAPLRRLGTRSQNILARGRLMTWARLCTKSPQEIAALPGCGIHTVTEILQAVLTTWARSEIDPAGHDRSGSNGAGAVDVMRDQALNDPEAVARALIWRDGAVNRRLREVLLGVEASDDPVRSLEVARSTRDVLLRNGINTVALLAESTPRELYELLGDHRGVTDAVAGIVRVWSALPQPNPVDRNDDLPERQDSDPRLTSFLRSAWANEGASAFGDVLTIASHDTSYDGTLWARLSSAPLEEIVELPRASDEVWSGLIPADPRDYEIFVARILPVKPALSGTEIGNRYRVSRARVGQIEARLKAAFEAALRDSRADGVRHLGSRARRLIGDVCNVRRAELIIAEVAADAGDAATQTEARHLIVRRLALSDAVEIDGYLWSARARRVLEHVEKEVQALVENDEFVVSHEVLARSLSKLVLEPGSKDVFVHRLGLRRHEEHYLVWRGSLADKAIACLNAAGHPLSMTEIHDAVGFDVNPRSLSGQVQNDERIVRVGKSSYALSSWGGAEYEGILSALERLVREAGGTANLSEAAERIAFEHGVSESSVRAYANDHAFIRDNGMISIRSAADPPPAVRSAPLEMTRGAVQIGGVWHARINVDADTIRGSGRPIRNAIALALGLEPELTVGLEFDAGELVFSWARKQPTVGSLRAVVAFHACAEGDLLFLPLEGDEPRATRVSRVADRVVCQGRRRLALELGQVEPVDDLAAAAVAIGLPPRADIDAVADRLTDRGESELLQFLELPWS